MFIILKRKEILGYELFFAVIFIGGFLFHLLWEAQGQYTIIYFFLIIPYAIMGWFQGFMKINGILDWMVKKSMIEKTCIWFMNIVYYLFVLIVGLLLIFSVFATAKIDMYENTTFVVDIFPVNILAIFLCIWLGAYVKKNRERFAFFCFFYSKKWIVTATILHMGILILWVLSTQLKPMTDQQYVMEVASNVVAGNYSDWQPGGYMYLYPFQNGIVMFYALLSILFGSNHYVLLQLVNIPFFLLGLYSLYQILKLQNYDNRICRLIYVLMPLWFPFSMYVTFVYGTVIGFSLAMLAIWFLYRYFHTHRFYNIILSALWISLAIAAKSNYSIFLIAILIMIVVDLIYTKKKKNILALGLLIGIYLLSSCSVNLISETVTGIETPKGIPKVAWATMGICGDETFGWWDGYNQWVYKKNNMDYDAAKAEALEKMSVRLNVYLKKPLYCGKFFLQKINSIWNNPTFQGITIQNARESDIEMIPLVESVLQDNGTMGNILKELLNIIQTLIYAGALAYMLLNRKQIDLYKMIYAILFIGAFVFQIVWEGKCQYTIFYFYLIIPYAIIGINDSVNWTIRHISRRRGIQRNVKENI